MASIRRMRILIVYNSALDARSVSGVQTYFAGVVRHWRAQGHVVDILVARAAWPVFRELFPDSRLISCDNLFDPTNHLGQTWRYLPAFAWRMISHRFTRFPTDYDVIFACAQFIYEIGPARALARRFNAALVAKVHHVLGSQRQVRGFFDRLHLWSERTSVRWLHREADAILCGTELIGQDFNAVEAGLGLSPTRTHPTGYGIDLDSIPIAVDTPKSFDAVLLGRVHEHKGAFDAVPVWTRVTKVRPGARLLVIGEGPHRVELAERFQKAGLAANVEFTGAIPGTRKDALLPTCRIGLSFSREEGWGLSVNEFLALGMPVVAMDLPVFHKVFPDQLDLVPPRDTDAAADRILYWLDQPREARQRGIDGREFVRRYDHRSVAAHEATILGEAIRHHGQKRRSRAAHPR
jgi:glycosyltransferase involved in cell wall biosynthesis